MANNFKQHTVLCAGLVGASNTLCSHFYIYVFN